jgi:hypothetical protein
VGDIATVESDDEDESPHDAITSAAKTTAPLMQAFFI